MTRTRNRLIIIISPGDASFSSFGTVTLLAASVAAGARVPRRTMKKPSNSDESHILFNHLGFDFMTPRRGALFRFFFFFSPKILLQHKSLDSHDFLVGAL